MIKITIISTGRFKEAWLKSAIEEYEKRIQSHILIEWVLYKNEEALYAAARLEPRLVALSPCGKELDSERFSKEIFARLTQGGSRMTLLIGGASGIPKDLLDTVPSYSLSKLTWSHQTVRLLLVEQLYRAYTLEKGLPYHL